MFISSMIGRTFGNLTVVKKVGDFGKLQCRCFCGRDVFVWKRFLISGKSDCGCVSFKEKDITGKKFGRWTVVGPHKDNEILKWICKCDCGKSGVVYRRYLLNGNSKSCGCLLREVSSLIGKKGVKDRIGKKFGRLMVVSREVNDPGKSSWMCRCDCGKETIVDGGSLDSGNTRSCGCLKRDLARQRMQNPNITEEERQNNVKRRFDPRIIGWKISVLRRDNKTCLVCGFRKKSMVAHHKNAWNKFKEQRFDLSNGVSCCKDCHKEYHSIFGYGDNTVEQWEEYLKMKGSNVVVNSFKRKRIEVKILGKKIGKLTVLSFDETSKTRDVGCQKWICKCECGQVKSMSWRGLRSGKTKSCGCLQVEKAIEVGKNRLIDLTNMISNNFTVIRRDVDHFWFCRCECGKEHRMSRNAILDMGRHYCYCNGGLK